MRLYHATPTRNLKSIMKRGLLAEKAIGPLKSVWLCKSSEVAWAVLHSAHRHNVGSDEVSVIAVDVPRDWLKKHSRPGLFHTSGNSVPVEHFSIFLTTEQR